MAFGQCSLYILFFFNVASQGEAEDSDLARVAKNSSDSSVKSKASIASVKTKTGSQASLKKAKVQ